MVADTLVDSDIDARPAGCIGVPSVAQSQCLADALSRLDVVLEAAIAELEGTFGRDPTSASFRGMCISPDDAAQLLALDPGRSIWSPPGGVDESSRFMRTGEVSRLATLQRRFDLDAFETDALLIAASPDLDQRYERLFALLQDDVTRQRPTLATIIHLAAARPLQQWQGLGRFFSSGSALLRSGLARVVADPANPLATLGAHYLVAEPQVVSFLAGHDMHDLSVHAFGEILTPGPVSDFDFTWHRHPELARALHGMSSGTLRFVGATAWERRHLAHAVASRLGVGLLCMKRDDTEGQTRSAAQELARAHLAARLIGAILFVETEASGPLVDPMNAGHSIVGGLCIVSSPNVDGSCRARRFEVKLPSAGERRARWQGHIDAAGRCAAPHDLDELSRELQLDTEQTDAAATSACLTPGKAALSREFLFAAARRPLALRLPRSLVAVEPQTRWHHLILTEDSTHQLHEICVHARERSRVLNDWGFGETSSRGQGVSVLFSGPSGTGKSTASEALAAELGRGLLKIDLSQTVSKYIGDSEKHLAEAFDIAERSGAVLMFDEADALFGKRTSVSDAHDRYANIEVSYLLQRIETFRGILVLTTNLQANIDTAFVRRLQFIVEFPFPDVEHRERIWNISVPAQAPRDPDLDFKALAQRYAVAGGSIRNISLSAAVLAASRGEPIAMRHMAHGAYREYQKLGKALPNGDYFSHGAPR